MPHYLLVIKKVTYMLVNDIANNKLLCTFVFAHPQTQREQQSVLKLLVSAFEMGADVLSANILRHLLIAMQWVMLKHLKAVLCQTDELREANITV